MNVLSKSRVCNFCQSLEIGYQNYRLATFKHGHKKNIEEYSHRVKNQLPMVSKLRSALSEGNSRQVLCSSTSTQSDKQLSEGINNSTSVPNPLQLTYFEGGTWIFEVSGVRFLVDPIVGSPLDFGIPWFYSGYKRLTKNMTVDDLPEVDVILITQSLDDHCHMKTLIPLSQKRPDLPVVATLNAQPLLKDVFKNATYLEPGQTTTVLGGNGREVEVKATAGPVLGPPWQRPENGYILRSSDPRASLYFEPHCYFPEGISEEAPVETVVTPVVKQGLPAYTLVSGQEDAVRLAKKLQAKFVVPMANGELDAKGLLSTIITVSGTNTSFQDLLEAELPSVQFLVPTPNVPLIVPSSQ